MKPVRIQPLNPAYHQLSQLLHEALLSLYAIGARRDEKTSLQKAGIVLSLYERHMAKEEAILFGILHEYEPCVSTLLLTNYRIITKQINDLRKLMVVNKKSNDVEGKQESHQLLYRFNGFVNICLAQMKEHQSIVNPVLWRYYSDEELKYMSSAFTINQSVFTGSGLAAA